MNIEPTTTILTSEFNKIQEELADLRLQVLQIPKLIKLIESLREEIRLLRNGKKSDTSSTPPSHDFGRSNSKSLRIKTGLKSGGQLGHEGRTLQIKAVPDEIIEHIPQFCNNCGDNLERVTAVLELSRQEVVIPPIKARYIEHHSFSRVCPKCGAFCTCPMPCHLTAPIQYGENVIALVGYLSVFQFIPYKRISNMFNNLFNLPISEGSIDNLLERLTQKALPIYNTIKQKIQQSKVVGGDETGSAVAGKKGWFHTWQTETLTFIVASLKRDFNTGLKYFADGFKKSVYVSDCWAAQLKTTALHHQICIIHLLRELRNFYEALTCNWSFEMKILLTDAMELKKKLLPEDYLNPPEAVLQIEERLANLLQYDLSKSHQRVKTFLKRMVKNKDSILTFLYHPMVPPHNNASEQAIRNVKVKTKISGQFRTEQGAKRFAILRSVIDTSIKNSQNVFDAFTTLAKIPE